MSFLASPQMATIWSRSNVRQESARNEREEADVEAQETGHGREASGRSILSNISGRLANFREQDRETERARQSQRAHAMAERLLNDLNLWRGVSGTARNDAANANGDGQNGGSGNAAQMSSMRKLTGKSRREREEGAALFGPNLANYFGSGSSSSGAIAGSTAAATAAAASGEQNANEIASTNADANGVAGSLRRPRLGSRGRARGASLSGLGSWMSNVEAIDSVHSLNDAQAQASGLHHVMSQESLGGMMVPSAASATVPTGSLAMAEGIEIDTLRRWIDRSKVGGTVEISSADEVEQVRGDAGNPPTLCSTLQSYVNLKRNTVKLHAIGIDLDAPPQSSNTQLRSPLSAASLHPFSQMQTHAMHNPNPTHTIQFEYDCAAPYASIQVFVRASRKHGSWLTWTTAREALGLSTDLTFGAADDGESRFYGQRGPPPHVLGWPVHFARVRKGFSSLVKVNVALQLDLYAPPKSESGAAQDPATADKVSTTVTEARSLSAPAPAMLIPETPGIDASRRLDDPVTPAAALQPVADPLSNIAPSNAVHFEGVNTASEDKEESKEAKAARERAERETLKVAIVIETLDEDGKPLSEPNLQTTYMRLASMPIKTSVRETEEVVITDAPIAEAAEELHQQAGPVLDVAITPEPSQFSSPSKRAWSVQVEGQEAEIGPHRFQLQELYGLSSRPPPPQQQQLADQEGKDANEDELGASNDPMPPLDLPYGDDAGGATECLICLSSPPSTLLLPCTHGLCLDCAVQLRDTVKATRESERRRGRRPKRKYACPVCRRIYTSMLYLRAVDEKYLAQASIV